MEGGRGRGGEGGWRVKGEGGEDGERGVEGVERQYERAKGAPHSSMTTAIKGIPASSLHKEHSRPPQC